MEYLKIGQLSNALGVSNDTVRLYEKYGLLDKPPRAKNGYRQYSKGDLSRLKFIIKAKTMGFTLNEISELLDIKSTHSNACHLIQEQAQQKLLLSTCLASLLTLPTYAASPPSSGSFGKPYANAQELSSSVYRQPGLSQNLGWYVNVSYLLGIPQASNNSNRSISSNKSGISIATGYFVNINPHNQFGMDLQLNKFGNIDTNDGVTTTRHSLQDFEMGALYQYTTDLGLSFGGRVAVGRMFGENTGRWMPIMGVNVGYFILKNTSINIAYDHYFGVDKDNAFGTNAGVPSINAFKFGVRYFF